jgi:hypothetical protein
MMEEELREGKGFTANRYLCHENLRILLGITGSVAAIKAPELICSLIAAFGANVTVKVILTKGGSSFWEKASAYDEISWDKIQEYILNPSRTQVEVLSKYFLMWSAKRFQCFRGYSFQSHVSFRNKTICNSRVR